MDQLANAFSALQNGQRRFQDKVMLKYSKILWNICHILYSEGFIQGFQKSQYSQHILVYLKYYDHQPVFYQMKKISLQGRRIYCEHHKLFVYNTASFRTFRILSTTQGILSEKDAHFFGLGGEVLCEIH